MARQDFDAVVELASEGIPTGRGQRMAYLHRDRVNGVLRPRRGARLAALTSGGAIPEVGDYRVVAEPDDTSVGTVNEDFAIESMVGDVFLLGTHSWRIRRVTQGEVRVTDAEGAQPTIPFWVGRRRAGRPSCPRRSPHCGPGWRERLGATGSPTRPVPLDLQEACGLEADAAEQLVGTWPPACEHWA